MTVWNVEAGPVSAVRGFWGFYRQYVHSAIHAASAAALTIFGLLVFIDPIFAAVAVAAYVGPPIVLYALGVEVGTESGESAAAGGGPADSPGPEPTTDYNGGVRPTDSNGDPGDSDSDSDDGDTDSDNDDGDSDDGDSDSDSDDGDTDSDGTDTDTDS